MLIVIAYMALAYAGVLCKPTLFIFQVYYTQNIELLLGTPTRSTSRSLNTLVWSREAYLSVEIDAHPCFYKSPLVFFNSWTLNDETQIFWTPLPYATSYWTAKKKEAAQTSKLEYVFSIHAQTNLIGCFPSLVIFCRWNGISLEMHLWRI